jgi:hypothetical protein
VPELIAATDEFFALRCSIPKLTIGTFSVRDILYKVIAQYSRFSSKPSPALHQIFLSLYMEVV